MDAIASSTVLPITRSVSTDADAWLDRAADGVVRHVRDDAVVEVHAQGHLVAAGRVDVVHLGLERLTQARACGFL